MSTEGKKLRDRIKRLTRGVRKENLQVYNRAATFEDKRTKRNRTRSEQNRRAINEGKNSWGRELWGHE